MYVCMYVCTGADLDILIGGAKTNKLSLINLVPIPRINH